MDHPLTCQFQNCLRDLIRLLLNLAPLAAVGCLVLAGISLRREGGTNFIIGGGFTKWMFWAAVFVTLPQTLSFLAARGLSVPSRVAAFLPTG